MAHSRIKSEVKRIVELRRRAKESYIDWNAIDVHGSSNAKGQEILSSSLFLQIYHAIYVMKTHGKILEAETDLYMEDYTNYVKETMNGHEHLFVEVLALQHLYFNAWSNNKFKCPDLLMDTLLQDVADEANRAYIGDESHPKVKVHPNGAITFYTNPIGSSIMFEFDYHLPTNIVSRSNIYNLYIQTSTIEEF